MRADEPPVVVEVELQTAPEVAWRAITDPVWMRQWYFDDIPDFRPELGFQTRFEVHCGERVFPHQWKVTAVETGKRLQYQWNYDGYPGDAKVDFEIQAGEQGCKLRVHCHVLEDFPDDIPEFRRESCIEGWQYLLQQSLPQFLAQQQSESS